MKRAHRIALKATGKGPSAIELHRQLNQRFFDKRARSPRFKGRERTTPHFRLPGTIRVEEPYIQLPVMACL
jgi:hypothetical protein